LFYSIFFWIYWFLFYLIVGEQYHSSSILSFDSIWLKKKWEVGQSSFDSIITGSLKSFFLLDWGSISDVFKWHRNLSAIGGIFMKVLNIVHQFKMNYIRDVLSGSMLYSLTWDPSLTTTINLFSVLFPVSLKLFRGITRQERTPNGGTYEHSQYKWSTILLR